jgi:hypothetical protein
MKRLLLAVFAAAFVLCVALCAQTCPQGFTLLGNICVLNSSSAGSSGAVQASNGTGGFADTGCTGSAASITCSAGFKGGASFSASGGETATPSAPSSDTLFFSSTAHLPQFTKAGDSTVDGTQVVPASGATSNQWVTYIDTLGVMHYAQPGFSNLSGSPTATQIGGAGTLTNATSGNAATATALAATPAACGSNQYATGIAASGNASCAQVGYSQVSGTPTIYYQTVQSNATAQTQRANLNYSTNFSLTDSSANNRTTVDLASTISANTSGNAATATTATNMSGGAVGSVPYQSAANTSTFLSGNTAATDQVLVSHGTGSAAQAPTLSNAPALSAANMTSFPTLNQSTTGNAATATALAATPTACGSNQYATGVAASGNASCAQVGYSQVSGTPTGGGIIENAGDNSAIGAGASYSWIAGTSTHVSAPGLIPTACTATNLVVYFSAAISAGGSIVTSLYDVTAASATALSVTAAASAAAGFYSDTTDTVTINPSHLYSMQTVNNASSSQTFAPYLWAFQCK